MLNINQKINIIFNLQLQPNVKKTIVALTSLKEVYDLTKDFLDFLVANKDIINNNKFNHRILKETLQPFYKKHKKQFCINDKLKLTTKELQSAFNLKNNLAQLQDQLLKHVSLNHFLNESVVQKLIFHNDLEHTNIKYLWDWLDVDFIIVFNVNFQELLKVNNNYQNAISSFTLHKNNQKDITYIYRLVDVYRFELKEINFQHPILNHKYITSLSQVQTKYHQFLWPIKYKPQDQLIKMKEIGCLLDKCYVNYCLFHQKKILVKK